MTGREQKSARRMLRRCAHSMLPPLSRKFSCDDAPEVDVHLGSLMSQRPSAPKVNVSEITWQQTSWPMSLRMPGLRDRGARRQSAEMCDRSLGKRRTCRKSRRCTAKGWAQTNFGG